MMSKSELSALSIMQPNTLFLVTAHPYSSCTCGMNIASELIFSPLLGIVSHLTGVLLSSQDSSAKQLAGKNTPTKGKCCITLILVSFIFIVCNVTLLSLAENCTFEYQPIAPRY